VNCYVAFDADEQYFASPDAETFFDALDCLKDEGLEPILFLHTPLPLVLTAGRLKEIVGIA
jgi:hypothetical protein